jgi:hypothetical protein
MNPKYYRDEAQRCLALAATSPNRTIKQRWLRLADEYLEIALVLDVRGEAGEQPHIPAQMQPQPVQQQQSKIKLKGRGTARS